MPVQGESQQNKFKIRKPKVFKNLLDELPPIAPKKNNPNYLSDLRR